MFTHVANEQGDSERTKCLARGPRTSPLSSPAGVIARGLILRDASNNSRRRQQERELSGESRNN